MGEASLLNACFALLRRDLAVAYRRRAEAANPLMFFIVVAALFPLGLGADPKVLQAAAPGLIWVAALLATLLSLDSIFRSDFEDGSLEQLVLSAHPLSVLVLSKVIAHWLVTGLPLIVVAPLLASMLGLPGHALGVLVATLALGTPVLSLIGAIGVALTVGLRRGGVLLSLLVLPLYVPVLVFGSNAVAMAAAGLPVAAQLYMLAALFMLALTLASFPTAAALRISLA
jgi:heme exporter protein B